jgi:hypothetical protein
MTSRASALFAKDGAHLQNMTISRSNPTHAVPIYHPNSAIEFIQKQLAKKSLPTEDLSASLSLSDIVFQ